MMLFSAVITKMVKYRYEQEKLRAILKDLLCYWYKQHVNINVIILIYTPINILSSQHFQHDSLVHTIFII